jgi:hypothetical protein
LAVESDPAYAALDRVVVDLDAAVFAASRHSAVLTNADGGLGSRRQDAYEHV